MAMSYRMPLSDKQRKIGRNIYQVQKEIIRAFMEVKAEKGLTQRALADKLGVNKSVVNRRLTGRTNLTLQTLVELAWAFDRELHVEFARPGAARALSHTRELSGKESWEQHKAPAHAKGTTPKVLPGDTKRIWAALKDQQGKFGFREVMNDNAPKSVPNRVPQAA